MAGLGPTSIAYHIGHFALVLVDPNANIMCGATVISITFTLFSMLSQICSLEMECQIIILCIVLFRGHVMSGEIM